MEEGDASFSDWPQHQETYICCQDAHLLSILEPSIRMVEPINRGILWPRAHRLAAVVFLLLLSQALFSQRFASLHFDAGQSNLSDGVFIRSGLMGAYEWRKFKSNGGIQLSPVGKREPFVTGLSLRLGREFSIKGIPFDVYAISMFNRFTAHLHEYNWGLLATMQREHFSFGLGTNFRTIALTGSAAAEYPAGTNTKLHENWNVLYAVSYLLKHKDHPWNVGLTFSNFDRFLLSQETNPSIYVHGEYRFANNLVSFVELWHRRAGAMNLSVSHFGIFIRAGAKWEFGSK